MNFEKFIKIWHSFQDEVNSMKTICKMPSQMNDYYEKIDLSIDCFEKKKLTNPEINDDFYSTWEQLYKFILDPSHFFEIDQIIIVLKQKEKILKAHIDIKIEDVEKYSLFIMSLEGLKNSWKNYELQNRIPQSLSKYNILISEMYSFFNIIFTEPQHQDTSKELAGIETVLFSLQSIMSNFQVYEKMIDSAKSVQAELSLSQK